MFLDNNIVIILFLSENKNCISLISNDEMSYYFVLVHISSVCFKHIHYKYFGYELMGQ